MPSKAPTFTCLVGFIAVMVLAAPAIAQPVGTAFSYQGAISTESGPVNGNLDLRFTLWQDEVGGSQLGPVIEMLATPVADGLFSVDLDFGADPFAINAAVWLQVEVDNVALPRQRLAPAPYSLSTRGITVAANGNVGIGTVSPDALLDVRDASSDGAAIAVEQTGGGSGYGVDVTVSSGTAIRGHNTATVGTPFGVYGWAPTNGWGVFANGRIGATGTKSFMIDHPLDPANAILLHYSSEAPEPLNTYSGTVILDAHGEALIDLPEYFEAINADYRYQLTAIGAAAPNLHVAEEIWNNRFSIAGGAPGLKVSWEVTARRNDAFVQLRGAPVEVAKDAAERGTYLLPEAYGAPADKAMHAGTPSTDRK